MFGKFGVKGLDAFVWLKVRLLKRPQWPVQALMLFCFQPWEHLRFTSGLTKNSLSCISPGSPPPLWTCKAASHLHQNEELQGKSGFAIFCWLQEDHFHIGGADYHDLWCWSNPSSDEYKCHSCMYVKGEGSGCRGSAILQAPVAA